MSEGGSSREILERLCRQASEEIDSVKLNVLIEQIDRLLDEQLQEQQLRKAA